MAVALRIIIFNIRNGGKKRTRGKGKKLINREDTQTEKGSGQLFSSAEADGFRPTATHKDTGNAYTLLQAPTARYHCKSTLYHNSLKM